MSTLTLVYRCLVTVFVVSRASSSQERINELDLPSLHLEIPPYSAYYYPLLMRLISGRLAVESQQGHSVQGKENIINELDYAYLKVPAKCF